MTEKETVFSNLIDDKLPMLRRVAYRITGNADDADEAVQEALVKGWKQFDHFRREAKLSSWVCRIVVNESYNLVRRKQQQLQMIAGFKKDDGDKEPQDEFLLRSLESAVAELPEVYRETVQLVILENLDKKTAAKLLQCNLNTLYWRIQKAKKLLRIAMQEVPHEQC